jgi:hypothetical protein
MENLERNQQSKIFEESMRERGRVGRNGRVSDNHIFLLNKQSEPKEKTHSISEEDNLPDFVMKNKKISQVDDCWQITVKFGDL